MLQTKPLCCLLPQVLYATQTTRWAMFGASGSGFTSSSRCLASTSTTSCRFSLYLLCTSTEVHILTPEALGYYGREKALGLLFDTRLLESRKGVHLLRCKAELKHVIALTKPTDASISSARPEVMEPSTDSDVLKEEALIQV